jgi:hypothetical protein
MNQLGDMGNKEKEIIQQGCHTRRKEGRKEGRKEKAVLHGSASPLQHMHNN